MPHFSQNVNKKIKKRGTQTNTINQTVAFLLIFPMKHSMPMAVPYPLPTLLVFPPQSATSATVHSPPSFFSSLHLLAFLLLSALMLTRRLCVALLQRWGAVAQRCGHARSDAIHDMDTRLTKWTPLLVSNGLASLRSRNCLLLLCLAAAFSAEPFARPTPAGDATATASIVVGPIAFAEAAWPFPPAAMLHPSSLTGAHVVEDTITFIGGVYYPANNPNASSRVSSVVVAFSPADGTWVQTLKLPDRICGVAFSFASTIATGTSQQSGLTISVIFFSYAGSFNAAHLVGQHRAMWIYAFPSASGKSPFVMQCDGVLNEPRMEATVIDSGAYMYVIGGIDPTTRIAVRSFEVRSKCCRLYEDCAVMPTRQGESPATWRVVRFPPGVLSITRASAVSFPSTGNATIILFGGIVTDANLLPGCTNAVVRLRLSNEGMEVLSCERGGTLSPSHHTNAVRSYDSAFTRGPDDSTLLEARANGGTIAHPMDMVVLPGAMLAVVSGSVVAMGGMTGPSKGGASDRDFMRRPMTNKVSIVFEPMPSPSVFNVFYLPPVLTTGQLLGTLVCWAGSELCTKHLQGVVVTTTGTCEPIVTKYDRALFLPINNKSQVPIEIHSSWFSANQRVSVCAMLPSCLDTDVAIRRGLSGCRPLAHRENCAAIGWCTVQPPGALTRYCCPDRDGGAFLQPILPRTFLIAGAAPPTTSTPLPPTRKPVPIEPTDQSIAHGLSLLLHHRAGLFVALVVGVALLACLSALLVALGLQLCRLQRAAGAHHNRFVHPYLSGRDLLEGKGGGKRGGPDSKGGSSLRYDRASSSRSIGGSSMSTVRISDAARRGKEADPPFSPLSSGDGARYGYAADSSLGEAPGTAAAAGSNSNSQGYSSSRKSGSIRRRVAGSSGRHTSAVEGVGTTAHSGAQKIGEKASSTISTPLPENFHVGGDQPLPTAEAAALSGFTAPSAALQPLPEDSANADNGSSSVLAASSSVNNTTNTNNTTNNTASSLRGVPQSIENTSTLTTTAAANVLGRYTITERLHCSRDRKTHVFRGYATPTSGHPPPMPGGGGDTDAPSPHHHHHHSSSITFFALKVILCRSDEDRLEATAEYARLKRHQQHAGVVKVVDYFIQWPDALPTAATAGANTASPTKASAALPPPSGAAGAAGGGTAKAAGNNGGRPSTTCTTTTSTGGGSKGGRTSSASASASATASSATAIDVAALLRGCPCFVCIVMPSYKAGDLHAYLRLFPEPVVPEPVAVKVVAQVANTLGYLHQLSPAVAHRNLRTENILIDVRRNRVVVADFGRAAEVPSGTAASVGGSQPQSSVGFAQQLGPFAEGPPRATAKEDDILALGLVAYAIATRRSIRAALQEYLTACAELAASCAPLQQHQQQQLVKAASSSSSASSPSSASPAPSSPIIGASGGGVAEGGGGLLSPAPSFVAAVSAFPSYFPPFACTCGAGVGGDAAPASTDGAPPASAGACTCGAAAASASPLNAPSAQLPLLRANMRHYSAAYTELTMRMLCLCPALRPDAQEVIRLCLDACPAFAEVRLAEA